jgi:hypothetical protein
MFADVYRRATSHYKCDSNDKHDSGGDHQNFESVIARNVIVCALYALRGHGCTPCQQTPIYFLASYLRGNADERIPHRVFLGKRLAARQLLLRVRTANHKSCDAMDSPGRKLPMRCCTFRIEKRGAKVLAGVRALRGAHGGDGGWRRRPGQADRQRPCAYARERTDHRGDNGDTDQRVAHGRKGFPRPDRPIQVLNPSWRRQLGTAMAATRQRQPASGIDLWALRLRRITVLPSAPLHRLNIYRRAEVAVDPVAGIGLLARELESRDRRSFADAKLNASIARHRRNRMPGLQTKV